ncbi:hypothetical protein [Algoriphagus zhangzhouensis]|nr:hypothetical protein [Algoriphagus zhangzhouensis]
MNLNQSLEPDSKVQILPKWEINEEKSYQFISESFELFDGDTISRNKVSYQVEMKVLDNTSNDLLLQWTYKNFVNEISEPKHSFSDIFGEIFDLLDGNQIQFEIDKSGAYLGLKNEEEIAEFEANIFEKIKEHMVNNYQVRTNSGMALGIAKGALNPFSSNDYDDFHTFFRLHGGSYEINKEVEIPVSLGQNREGEKLKVHFHELNQKTNEMSFSSNCDFDLINSNKLEGTDETTLVNFSLKNESKINDAGWPICSREERITSSAQKTKVEVRTLELL